MSLAEPSWVAALGTASEEQLASLIRWAESVEDTELFALATIIQCLRKVGPFVGLVGLSDRKDDQRRVMRRAAAALDL